MQLLRFFQRQMSGHGPAADAAHAEAPALLRGKDQHDDAPRVRDVVFADDTAGLERADDADDGRHTCRRSIQASICEPLQTGARDGAVPSNTP